MKWTIEKNGRSYDLYSVRDENGVHITDNLPYGLAILIATAPEMLEELELAAKRFDFAASWIENSYGGKAKDVELIRSYARVAQAIVAKAKGRNNENVPNVVRNNAQD